MNYLAHKDFYLKMFGGNEAATALCGCISTILNNRKKAKYTEANLYMMLFDIADNPFYRSNYQHLSPIVKNTLFAWRIADTLDDEEKHREALELRRDSVVMLILACVYSSRGYDAVMEEGQAIKLFVDNEFNCSCVDRRDG